MDSEVIDHNMSIVTSFINSRPIRFLCLTLFHCTEMLDSHNFLLSWMIYLPIFILEYSFVLFWREILVQMKNSYCWKKSPFSVLILRFSNSGFVPIRIQNSLKPYPLPHAHDTSPEFIFIAHILPIQYTKPWNPLQAAALLTSSALPWACWCCIFFWLFYSTS